MSDRDSLDELIDDVDYATEVPVDTRKSISDLDALLDEVVGEYDDMVRGDDDNIGDIDIAGHLKSSDERTVDSALIGVPLNLKKKWMDFLQQDLSGHDSDIRSYAYRSWNDDTPKFSVDKCLKDIIMKVAPKCGLSDSQARRIESAATGSALKYMFIGQILADKKSQILNDPNFDPSAYPWITKALNM